MDTRIYDTTEFAVDVISKGAFVDKVDARRGDIFLIETIVIRLSPKAVRMWVDSNEPWAYRHDFDSKEKYQAFLAEKIAEREQFNKMIKDALGINGNRSFEITRNISEIFTVVTMRKISENSAESEPRP